MMLPAGQYRHYKGGIYTVLGVARHSESEEELVVYVSKNGLWVRPLKMFTESVTHNGQLVARFEYIGLTSD